VLLSVVQHGSMVKAAERLATTQPAVSRAIADLEHSLGVRLLDRGPRGVVPTPYGRSFIKRGNAVFDEIKQGIKDIEFLADPTAGEVRIAAPIGLAGFLAVVIDRLARRHPRVVCHLMTGEGTIPYRALEERDVDLVIDIIVRPITEEHLQTEVLYEASRFVVAATQNPWSHRRKVALSDLMNEPWTLPSPDSLPGLLAADDFRAAGLDVPRATVVTHTAVARVVLVAKGRFLTIAGKAAMEFAGGRTAIKALPIELATTHGYVGIITLKNRTLTPVAKLFIDCAREVAKPLAAGKSSFARRRQAQEK
jgi:DNA-binding transcriptional LysR family regulator